MNALYRDSPILQALHTHLQILQLLDSHHWVGEVLGEILFGCPISNCSVRWHVRWRGGGGEGEEGERGGGGGGGVLLQCMNVHTHDTNHHVVPKSMQLQTVLFRPG